MGFSPSAPYPYVPVNDDDDDENGRMDNHNREPDGPLVNGLADDDLVPLLISVDSPVFLSDGVTLGINQDPDGLLVWEEPNRAGPIVMGWPDYAHSSPASDGVAGPGLGFAISSGENAGDGAVERPAGNRKL
jgi:hypothetical protein